MMRFGSLIATVFGIAGFIGFGLWGALQCEIFGIGHRLNCGWVFILMAPIGFVVGGLLFQSIKALMRVFAVRVEKLMLRLLDSKNSPDG